MLYLQFQESLTTRNETSPYAHKIQTTKACLENVESQNVTKQIYILQYCTSEIASLDKFHVLLILYFPF